MDRELVDDLLNAEREAHQGRVADAIPLILRAVTVVVSCYGDLVEREKLLEDRVAKLERDYGTW